MKILPCSCEHPHQDKEYGKNRAKPKQSTPKVWRCTVCRKEKSE